MKITFFLGLRELAKESVVPAFVAAFTYRIFLRAETTSSSARVDRGGGGAGRLHHLQQGLLSLHLGQSQVVTILSGSGGILSGDCGLS